MFNTIINTNERREVFISGGVYTWSNNHESPTLEKLDTILMTKEWEAIFSTVHVYKVPRTMSDHNPLVLSTQQNTPVQMRIFIFELSWLKDPDFLVKVKKI
jgi:hypothetical protein